jgi:hypothetical protein
VCVVPSFSGLGNEPETIVVTHRAQRASEHVDTAVVSLPANLTPEDFLCHISEHLPDQVAESGEEDHSRLAEHERYQ